MSDEKGRQDLRLSPKQFALRIINICSKLPDSRAGRVLGDGVFPSGTSVAANYPEAYRARSQAEFLSKLGESQKELEETILWFELSADSGTVKPGRLSRLIGEAGELMALFTSIIKRTRSNPS